MKLKHAAVLALIFLSNLQSILLGQQGENLLKNSGFGPSGSDTRRMQGWSFSEWNFRDNPGLAEKLDWGVVVDSEGERCLFISSKESVKTNVWWQQQIEATPGASYELKATVKGALQAGSKYGGVSVGVYFLDQNGHWLGYQEVPGLKPHEDWQTVELKVTVPEEAAKVGIRLGTNFNGLINVSFKKPVLTKTAN